MFALDASAGILRALHAGVSARLALGGFLILTGCAAGGEAGSRVGMPSDAVRALEGARAREPWLHDTSSTPRPARWRQAMNDPLEASAAADEWADLLAAKSPEPQAVLQAMGTEVVAAWGDELGVARRVRASVVGGPVSLRTTEMASPPLVSAEDLDVLPAPLRAPVSRVLVALSAAESARRMALAGIPSELTPERLREQVRNGPSAPGDYRLVMGKVSMETLVSGGSGLVAAVAQLRHELGRLSPAPPVVWLRETPLGTILVDTTGADNRHRLVDPLLVVDVGGNDTYEFVSRANRNRISVLLDIGGDDTYFAEGEGADPSAAILGIGILWDTAGNDTYRGGHFAHASSAFGIALLVDEGGDNRFEAIGHSQAHAVAGVALMITGEGNDRYAAQTAAQGSAGPGGVALLMDRGGDDRYWLTATPLVRASAQLPERNASIGQGTGYGIRAGAAHGGPAAGGLGMLLDLAGDDRYEGQVFAQGTGYQQGIGMLVDFGGQDQFDVAWYGQAASAHGGVGMLTKRGSGNDRYVVSHSMGIGAAHDVSVAVFRDEGGDDSYRVPDLGLGAAHDNGLAVFLDLAGSDTYAASGTVPDTATGAPCRLMGAAILSEPGTAMGRMPNAGLFADLAGDDRWPVACLGKRGGVRWRLAR